MKNFVLTISFLLLCNLAFGYTCSTKKVNCPIDKASVEFCVTMSMTTFGGYLDFQKRGAIGNHYQELINSCPKCHYSGFVSDFDTTFTSDKKNEIKAFLSKYKNTKVDEAKECQIAGELKEFLGETNDAVSNCFLVGSYLLRMDSTRIAYRKELQDKTKNYLIKALDKKEYEDSSIIATIHYLIAEMSRRTGNFKQAIIYFDKAIQDPNKKEWIEEVAIQQKELAIKEDDANNI